VRLQTISNKNSANIQIYEVGASLTLHIEGSEYLCGNRLSKDSTSVEDIFCRM
jgi:hypothetical protein